MTDIGFNITYLFVFTTYSEVKRLYSIPFKTIILIYHYVGCHCSPFLNIDNYINEISVIN